MESNPRNILMDAFGNLSIKADDRKLSIRPLYLQILEIIFFSWGSSRTTYSNGGLLAIPRQWQSGSYLKFENISESIFNFFIA